METKICKKCNQEKEVSFFGKNYRSNGKYVNTCKSCVSDRKRERLGSEKREIRVFYERQTKICSTCKQEKFFFEFYKCKRTKDGLEYDCKDCKSNKRRELLGQEKRNVTIFYEKQIKICCYCKMEKPFEDFPRNKNSKSGRNAGCKKCVNLIRRETYPQHSKELKQKSYRYYQQNKEKCLEKQREYLKENQTKVKEYKAKYFREHREECYARGKEWRDKNPKKVKQYAKISYIRGRDKKRKYQKTYSIKNKERINERERKRWNSNPILRLNDFMRGSIRYGLQRIHRKKNNRSWKSFVNYELYDLVKHLESQFQPGMTWENYGEWVVDHILPIKLFTYNSYEDPQFIFCWSLQNLRPMWLEENLKKNDFLPNGRRATYLTEMEKLEYLKELGFNFIKS